MALETIDEKEITSEIKLREDTKDIAQKLVEESNPNQIKDLTQLFNLNLAKQNALRLLKYNDLLDYIADGMVERFEKRPDEMSNKDLMDYMNTIMSTIEKTQKSVQQTGEAPQVVINQQTNNQINIESTELNRDSRERVMDFIKSYLENIESLDNINIKEEDSSNG